MEDAERVARAMAAGPDLASFVSDYQSSMQAAGEKVTADLVAEAWAERACADEDSDVVFQDVVSIVVDQVKYYL